MNSPCVALFVEKSELRGKKLKEVDNGKIHSH